MRLHDVLFGPIGALGLALAIALAVIFIQPESRKPKASFQMEDCTHE